MQRLDVHGRHGVQIADGEVEFLLVGFLAGLRGGVGAAYWERRRWLARIYEYTTLNIERLPNCHFISFMLPRLQKIRAPQMLVLRVCQTVSAM